MTWKGIDPKPPKHPVTKQPLVGGFNPLTVSNKPFGFRETVIDDECPYCPGHIGYCYPDCASRR